MIYHLNGKISHLGKNYLVMDVNNIGYLVYVPQRILKKDYKDGKALKLFIYTYLREDNISLYGFENMLDREFFALLIKISGVGPKTALGILSKYETPHLAKIILDQDIESLLEISGIGKKTAQKIIIDAQEKVGLVMPKEKLASDNDDAKQAVNILAELGCSKKEAESAVAFAVKEKKAFLNFEDIVSESLKFIERGQ